MFPPLLPTKAGGTMWKTSFDATPAAADAEDSGSEDESNGEEADEEEGFVFRPVWPGHPPPRRGQREDDKGPADGGQQELTAADCLHQAV